MAAVIIRKKDLINLGRKLMKEVYKHLHDDYMLTYDEIKVERDNIKQYLLSRYFESFNFKITQKKYSWSIEHEKLDENKHKELLKEIEDKIENESLDIHVIFKVLNSLKLDMELDEDLFFKTKGFINIFKVYDSDSSYLED